MTQHHVPRRVFLKTAAASAAAATLAPALVPNHAAAESGRSPATGHGELLVPVKLGVASYSLRKFPRDKALEMIKALRTPYVNFKSVHLPYDTPLEELAELRKHIEAAGFQIVGGGTIDFTKDTDDDVRRYFDYARAAGMPLIVGTCTRAVLPRIERQAKQYDIKVAIHNHGPEDKHFPSPYDVLEAVRNMDPRMGLCMDIGHTARTGTDIVKAALDAGPRLLDMHAKDLRDASNKESQCIVGEGVLPIPELFHALATMGYSGYVNLEYEIDADDPLPGMKQSFAYMRGVLAGQGQPRAVSARSADQAVTVAVAARPSADFVEVVRNDAERRVDVLVGGKPFTSYIYPTLIKKPVLYPLRTAKGLIVTRGYPLEPRAGERVDHPHHVGLWFDYGNVDGLDFWNNSTAIKASQAPHMGTIVHRAVRGVKSGNGEGTLDVTMDWTNAAGRALLREDTRFVFRAHDGARTIDRITTLTALHSPVTLPDDKEGLIGMRVARSLEQPSTTPEKFVDASGRATTVPVLDNTGVTGHYRSSEGKEGDAVWGTRGRWTMLTGRIGNDPVTLAILDHPSNVGFPTYWHARGYGLFAANNLGEKALSNGTETLDFRLDAGKSVTFRHEILLLDGTATPGDIETYYAAFAR